MVRSVLMRVGIVVAVGLLSGCAQGPIAGGLLFGALLSLIVGCGAVVPGETGAKFAKVVPIRFVPEPVRTPAPVAEAPAEVAAAEQVAEPVQAEAPRVRPRSRIQRRGDNSMASQAVRRDEVLESLRRNTRLGPSYWRDRVQAQGEKNQ